MSIATPLSSYGFGDYPLPPGQTFSQQQLCEKIQKIFLSILYSCLTALCVFLTPISWPIGLLGCAVFSYKAIQSMLSALGLFYRSPPMTFPKEVETAVAELNRVSDVPCSGFATRDGVESHQWKLDLIRAARHTIFISGCYCGGKSFDETLDLVAEQMQKLPKLKVDILCSNIFITAENKKRIQGLQSVFSEQFTCVITPEVFPYYSPATGRFALSTNHTKALVIDYGAAFMVGGSGIVSLWAEQQGRSPREQIERHGLLYDHLFKAKAYRDMDFVFQSPEPNGVGSRLYLEMAKLFQRFQYQEPKTPALAKAKPCITLPAHRQIKDLRIACYATGPEHPLPNPFHEEVIKQIKSATKTISIAHMYFHPTSQLQQALIDASNRGVKITLITNQLGSQSPGSHITYAELSRYYAKKLFEGRSKPHVEHFEYTVPYCTFHKKVILIDGKTALLGSANIGKKSLEGLDYEIDLKVESEEFAASIATSLEEDKLFSKKDLDFKISFKTKVFAFFQSQLTTPFL